MSRKENKKTRPEKKSKQSEVVRSLESGGSMESQILGEEKRHANHGKPCANPACQETLVTGKIRGNICTRRRCKRWGRDAGVTKQYRQRGLQRRPLAEVSGHRQAPQVTAVNGRVAQEALGSTLGARRPLHRAVRLLGVSVHYEPAEVAANLHMIEDGEDDRMPGTLIYHVEGTFGYGADARPGYDYVPERELMQACGLTTTQELGAYLGSMAASAELQHAASCIAGTDEE